MTENSWLIGMIVFGVLAVVCWGMPEIIKRARVSNSPQPETATSTAPSPPAAISESGIARLIQTVIVLGCVIAALIFVVTRDFSGPRWAHDTLTPAEQEIDKAECEKDALREVGHGDLDPELSGRALYLDACLRAKGFTKERIEKGGGE